MMKFLTSGECAGWCRVRDYPIRVEGNGYQRLDLDAGFSSVELPYPVDCGKKVFTAKQIVDWALEQGEVLFWIEAWDVWPSSQHLPLFTRFREALGERRRMDEAPGHLVDRTDRDDAVSVLASALLFIWDCHVLRADGGPVFHCSHDEWNDVFVPAGQSTDEIVRVLQKLSLRE